MGYLDNTSITVDAVLTKKGRELLSSQDGTLNITSFTCSDTGIDYTLWNPDHPSGSAFYGEAIENMPMLESSVHAEYHLRNKLITLGQDTTAMPALEIGGLTSTNTLTIKEGNITGIPLTITLKGWSSGGTGDQGLYVVMSDPDIAHPSTGTRRKSLSGISQQYLREVGFNNAAEWSIPGTGPDWNIHIRPNTELKKKGRQTQFFVNHPGTGAWASATVVVDIERVRRATRNNPTG
tara:strand:+ start:372 stop:1079 length:708 start_codon:yes stop_codon:yes gene_type:complete